MDLYICIFIAFVHLTFLVSFHCHESIYDLDHAVMEQHKTWCTCTRHIFTMSTILQLDPFTFAEFMSYPDLVFTFVLGLTSQVVRHESLVTTVDITVQDNSSILQWSLDEHVVVNNQ